MYVILYYSSICVSFEYLLEALQLIVVVKYEKQHPLWEFLSLCCVMVFFSAVVSSEPLTVTCLKYLSETALNSKLPSVFFIKLHDYFKV